MEENGMPGPMTPLRHLRPVDLRGKSDLLPTYESSWAVIVGINHYIHFNRLDNALKDALGMAEVLVTRLDFPRENVFLALDPKPDPREVPHALSSNVRSASKADIEDLLLNVLPEKAGENDRVLVFYAGHGDQRPVPREKDRSGAFLIPADALPGKWNTYVEWEMVCRAGDNFCKAKHIFYILDACYSGIINVRDASEPPREVRDALTTRARQALAAGTSRQVVADAGREGHSPFTWHLIQGLRGDAAAPERSAEGSVVSAHDLIGYVKHKVAEEHSTEQTPSGGSIAGHGGGDFIFKSPLLGFSGQEHMRLGVGLVELALRTGEQGCFDSAVRNLQQAVHLMRMAREDAAETEEWLGRALLHTGSGEALRTLSSAAAQGRATALLNLGIGHARRGKMDAARQSLESFADSLPNHADAAWAAAYAHQLRETGGKRKYALLTGVNRYPSFPLRGCVNDVCLVKTLLEEVYGFDPAYIKTLTDEQATAANIVTELENLAGVALPQDTVVFLFSGHGSQMPAMNASLSCDGMWYVLCPYDLRVTQRDWQNTITEPELHALLTQIPARDKLFIASAAHVCPGHDPSARNGGYRFFAACQRNQFDTDTHAEGKPYGVFVYQLAKTVRESLKKEIPTNAGRIALGVRKALKDSKQVPQYFGNPAAPLLPRGAQPDYLALDEFSDRREYAALDTQALEVWQTRLRALGDIPHPRAWLSCARAWISQGQPIRSLYCAEQALQQAGCDEREARLIMCEAHLRARKPDAAIEDAQALLGYLSPDEFDAQIKRMTQLSSPHRRALIVAIQKYPKAIGINLKGPCADAEALKAALTDRCDFASGDIEVLINKKATRTAILSKFDDLVQHAKFEPALFYFAGLGTDFESGPAVVVADASKSGECSTILLEELSHRTQVRPSNLVAIFDAGWTNFDNVTAKKMAAMRVFIPEEERDLRSFMPVVERDPTLVPQIGLATIYTGSIVKSYEREPDLIALIQKSGQKKRSAGAGTRGTLTMTLVDALRHGDALAMTYAEWVEAAAGAKPHAHLQRGGARLFENAVMLDRALRPVERLRDRNLHETEELLHRLTELRRGRDPDSYLDLAVARMMCNHYDDARQAAEMCLMHRRQQSAEADADRVTGDVSWPEAHYIRGRILFALRHYSAAESSLGIALQQYRDSPKPRNVQLKLARDTHLARAYYWHGRAVQELIRQNLLTAAEVDFKEYLRLGAPFGDSDRATAFLDERTKTLKVKGSKNSKMAKRKRG